MTKARRPIRRMLQYLDARANGRGRNERMIEKHMENIRGIGHFHGSEYSMHRMRRRRQRAVRITQLNKVGFLF